MIKPPKTAPCWVITEGMAGTENQCLGIAEALDLPYEVIRISLKEPWKTLSPFIGFEKESSFTPPLKEPWPDLILASGRKSIAASRFIKKASKGKTFTVQIQDPRVSSTQFDLVAVPAHDPLRGDNVVVTKASPNKVTQKRLEQAKEQFSHLGEFQEPRVAVLIGGTSKAYTMTKDITESLVQNLSKIDASLMVTCSRRTGTENKNLIESALTTDKNYVWDGTGENPYLGFLAWADYILVTADSASMISESCTTGKPVYMIDLDGGAKRISQLHQNLIEYGALRKFEGQLETFSYKPLNDSQMVAEEIKKRLKDFTKGGN